MDRENQKSNYERNVFLHFLKLSGLNVNQESIINGNPNKREPDILCQYINGEAVGFELGRLTNPVLSAEINSRESTNGAYIRTRDHSGEITNKKLEKKYDVSFSVELLLYRENPIITPENVMIPTIKPLCESVRHSYKRIWFMGKNTEILYENN